MTIKYSCFISYPHSAQSELLDSFITQLKKALANQIGLSITEEVYLDEERLKPGYSHRDSLALALCQSVCMIAVFSPLYQKSEYCSQEFLAMEKIEEKRSQVLGQAYIRNHRMIIPIIIKKSHEKPLPDKITDIKYWDISKHILVGFNLESIDECKKMVKQIADVVTEHYEKLEDLKDNGLDALDCSSLTFPTVEEAKTIWKGESPKSTLPLPFH